MKFKVQLEVEILDDELLELINAMRDWDDLEPYVEITDVPEEEILKFLKEDNFMKDEITYYADFEATMEITIIKE